MNEAVRSGAGTGPVLLGVDVATADVRVLAVRPDGTVVAAEAGPLPPPRRPRPGWSEQDPAYAEVACDVLAKVMAGLAGAGIAGVAVTSTSGTVLPCSAAGVPTGPALLYDDRRARPAPGPAVAGDSIGAAAPGLDRIGWLARHRPAARYLHVSDVVAAALAGTVLATDTSHALKTGADPATGSWRTDLLAAAGVDPAWLPALAPPGRQAGVVGAAAARRTGLPAGTPIVLGMTDGCTGQVAAGAVRPGDSVGVLGTTLVLKVVARHPVRDATGAVYSHRAPDGYWWPGGASNVGAGLLRAEFGGADLAALDEAAGQQGPAGLVRYPLPRRGERFPFASAAAVPVADGTARDRVEAYRAVLEGVAFTERLGFEVLGARGAPAAGTLRAVGGGSRSETWLRIRAAASDRAVAVPREPSSGFGAAVLAAAATVHDGLGAAVEAMVRVDRTIQPDPAERDRLAVSYQRFLRLLTDHGWLTPTGPEPQPDPEED